MEFTKIEKPFYAVVSHEIPPCIKNPKPVIKRQVIVWIFVLIEAIVVILYLGQVDIFYFFSSRNSYCYQLCNLNMFPTDMTFQNKELFHYKNLFQRLCTNTSDHY